MGLFTGESIMLERTGLLSKSLGKPLGRLSLMEHPERKSPLSSSGSLVTSGPTYGILFALADREPIQNPGWHKQSLALESGRLGWAWGRSLEASFGSGGGGALTLFWPRRMTDFTV